MADDIVTRLRSAVNERYRSQVWWLLSELAADEIERLTSLLERTYRLAIGHGPDFEVFDSWEDALAAYEKARRD